MARKKAGQPKRKKRISAANLKKLEQLQEKKFSKEKVRQLLWEVNHKRLAERVMASLPIQLKRSANDLFDWQNPAPKVKRVCSLIENNRERKVIAKIFEILALHNPWWTVRKSAVMGLSEIGSRRSIPVLEKVLSNDNTTFVRQEAAMALGKLGSTKSVPLLKRVTENDSGIAVRWDADRALKMIEGEKKKKR